MDDIKFTKNSVFGLSLNEPGGSFRLGTDSLLLSAFIKRDIRGAAAELGAGSGIISLLLKRKGFFTGIYAFEVQDTLYQALKMNIEENGFSGEIEAYCKDIRDIDPRLYPKVRTVYANPPYMKVGNGKESSVAEKQIARHEVFGGIEDFCKTAAGLLSTGGKFYTVYRPDRLETLMSALKDNGFSAKRMTFVCASEKHSPSAVLTEAVLDAKESLKITRTLFLNTEEYEKIHQSGDFPADLM